MLNKKKFVKKKIKNIKIKINRIINKIVLFFRQKHRKLTYVLITLILLMIISPFILSKTFFSDENKISKVNFLPENIEKFDDAGLYKKIENNIMGKNIFLMKYLNSKSLLEDVQKEYNIVKDIKLNSDKEKRNNITVEIQFKDLSFLFNDGARNIGVLDNKFYILTKTTTFLSGTTKIYLPSYTQEINEFTGFFYKIPEKKLKMQIKEIRDFFGEENISKIKYIPGGTRTLIELKESNISTGEQKKLQKLAENDIGFGKKILFNNSKDISKQLNLYLLTKQEIEKGSIPNTKFDQIEEIDLGGLDFVIICIDQGGCLKK